MNNNQQPEAAFLERAQAWTSRRAGWILLLIVLLTAWLWNHYYFAGSWQTRMNAAGANLSKWATHDPQATSSALLLFATTLFLAYANLYLKISLRSPSLQRRLSPRVFFSLPFFLYFGVYFTLAVLAHAFYLHNISPWYVAALVSALVGIGAANTDIKFGGFNVQPLSEFLRSLETVVEAGIGTLLGELDIAKSSALRDRLALLIDTKALERECHILGIQQADLDKLKQLAQDDEATYRGLLAQELVRSSEANARRLIESAREQGFLERLRRTAA